MIKNILTSEYYDGNIHYMDNEIWICECCGSPWDVKLRDPDREGNEIACTLCMDCLRRILRIVDREEVELMLMEPRRKTDWN